MKYFLERLFPLVLVLLSTFAGTQHSVMDQAECLPCFAPPAHAKTPDEPDQLATEYNGLVFREGLCDFLYVLDLKSERLKRIASNVGVIVSVSPDGRTVAYESEGKLHLVTAEGTNLEQVTLSEGEASMPSWSPDGVRLMYESAVPPPATGSALYTVSLVTQEKKRISPDGLFVRRSRTPASWFPDGKRALFRACRESPTLERDSLGASSDVVHYDLYLTAADGSDLVNLTNGIGNVMDFYLSPDGQTVVFTSYRENQAASAKEGIRIYDSKVYLLSVETKAIVEVKAASIGSQGSPLSWYTFPWSPNSDWVLLPTHWPDILQAVEPSGSLHHEIIGVSHSAQGDIGLDWLVSGLSPDGKTIAGKGRFEEGGSQCLCSVDANGANFRALVPDVYVVRFTWSPDGKSIFFEYTVEEYSSQYQYGIVNADGSSFYDPFASLSEKPAYVEDVHWVQLSSPVSAPTAIASLTASSVPTVTAVSTGTPTPSPTSMPSPTAIPLVSEVTMTATATAFPTSATVTASTPTSGGGICAVSGAVVFVAVLGWWALREKG